VRPAFTIFGAIILAVASAPAAAEQTIQAGVYLDRLHGMWLGEIIGNYAGRPTEGLFTIRGGNPASSIDWSFITTNPWRADDDTLFEYMDLYLVRDYGLPTGDQLKAAWESHVFLPSFAVANRQARYLMAYGQTPPQTGSRTLNMNWWAIDSQITTEALGAAAPGLRQRAADLAGAFGSVTNDGYAVHAAQFYAAMFAAAPFETSAEALVAKGLEVVPTTSRTYQVIQDVRTWYADDEKDGSLDWRAAQGQLYDKYTTSAALGRYHGWVESTVNAGLTTLALLYGEGDFKSTVEIGVLAGFDCDCNAATAGGLVGMMRGYAGLPKDLTDAASNRYANSSLLNMPAETTITQVAADWRAAAEKEIVRMGGTIEGAGETAIYHLPADTVTPPPEKYDPTGPKGLVGTVRRAGGTVTTSASVERHVPAIDSQNLDQIADGITDFSYNGRQAYTTSDGANPQPPGGDWYQLNFDRPVIFTGLAFYEGEIVFAGINNDPRVSTPYGGYFIDALTVEVRTGGTFVPVASRALSAEDAWTYFQKFEFAFAPATGDAIRIRGNAGGIYQFTSAVELEAYGAVPIAWTGAGDRWDTASNWFGGMTPGTETAAVFDAAAPHQPQLYQNENIWRIDFRTSGWTIGGAHNVTLGPGGIISAATGKNTIQPSVAMTADSTWTVGAGGTVVASGGIDGAGYRLTKSGPGTLRAAGAMNLAGLALSAGTFALESAAGPKTIATQALEIAESGGTPQATLDLATGCMVVDYTGDPAKSPIEQIKSWLASGWVDVDNPWTGPGITSTACQGTNADLYTLAFVDQGRMYAETGELWYGTASDGGEGLFGTTFGGVAVDDTTILVKFTYAGDVNLDGRVNIDDMGIINAAYDTPGLEYSGGDILWFDGYVGIDEMGLVNGAYGNGVTSGDPLGGLAGLTAAPEPATLALLAAGLAALARRRYS
jgi:hypothetical protein